MPAARPFPAIRATSDSNSFLFSRPARIRSANSSKINTRKGRSVFPALKRSPRFKKPPRASIWYRESISVTASRKGAMASSVDRRPNCGPELSSQFEFPSQQREFPDPSIQFPARIQKIAPRDARRSRSGDADFVRSPQETKSEEVRFRLSQSEGYLGGSP